MPQMTCKMCFIKKRWSKLFYVRFAKQLCFFILSQNLITRTLLQRWLGSFDVTIIITDLWLERIMLKRKLKNPNSHHSPSFSDVCCFSFVRSFKNSTFFRETQSFIDNIALKVPSIYYLYAPYYNLRYTLPKSLLCHADNLFIWNCLVIWLIIHNCSYCETSNDYLILLVALHQLKVGCDIYS